MAIHLADMMSQYFPCDCDVLGLSRMSISINDVRESVGGIIQKMKIVASRFCAIIVVALVFGLVQLPGMALAADDEATLTIGDGAPVQKSLRDAIDGATC